MKFYSPCPGFTGCKTFLRIVSVIFKPLFNFSLFCQSCIKWDLTLAKMRTVELLPLKVSIYGEVQ